MKKGILFDIDGTILDTSEFVFTAVEHTFKTHSLKTTKEEIENVKGKPLLEFYKTLFPNQDFEAFAKTHHEFQVGRYQSGMLFPNVETTLKKLKDSGYKIAAVSNRSNKGLVESLGLNGVLQYFDTIVGTDNVVNPKPHPDHPMQALKNMEILAEDAIMVGDTQTDILAGKNAKIKTVGVTYGWIGNDIKKHNPDFIIDSLPELLKILK